jgi:hypothetical protein
MELEFRTEKGELLFSIKGEIAELQFDNLQKLPEFIKTTKTFEKSNGDKVTRVVLEAIIDCSYKLTLPTTEFSIVRGKQSTLHFMINKGAYIKVL